MAERRGLALIGYFGAGNFGDDLLLSYGQEVAQAVFGGEPVYASQMGPFEGAMAQAGLTPVAGKNLRLWSRVFSSVRGVLFPGGGVFQDVTSLKSVGLYAALASLARLRGARVGAYGQSLTPWRTGVGKSLAAGAFRRMDFAWWRDELSLAQAQEMGLSGTHLGLCADPAWGLQPLALHAAPAPFIGVNLRPWDGVLGLMGPLQDFLGKLEDRFGWSVTAVALNEEDAAVLTSLDLPRKLVYSPDQSPAAFLGQLAGLSVAVGMRYHFLVCAAKAGAPFWAISYDQKTDSLARELRQPIWARGAGGQMGIVASQVPDAQAWPLHQKNLVLACEGVKKRHSAAQKGMMEQLKKWT